MKNDNRLTTTKIEQLRSNFINECRRRLETFTSLEIENFEQKYTSFSIETTNVLICLECKDLDTFNKRKRNLFKRMNDFKEVNKNGL